MGQGSDQSLSDEDEPDQVTYDLNFSGRIQSLLFCGRKLQDADGVNDQRIPSMLPEKVELLMSENGIHRTNHEDHEVMQNHLRDDHHPVSSSESISDEENMVLTELSVASPAHLQGSLVGSVSKNQEGECSTRLEVKGESKELSSLHKKACSSTFTSRISEPRKGTYKSFGEHGNLDDNTFENVMVHLKQHQKVVPAKLAPDKIVGPLPSMAELLEDLAKNGQATEALDVKLLKNARLKEIKTPYYGRTVSHLGSRFFDNEDPLEFMGCGTSSEDEESNHNHSCFPMESIKQHTMGDLFQETFNVSAEGSPSLSKNRSTGYYGRVQQVIQIERERHLEFLKQPQTVPTVHNDPSIMVQIITRFLEAKLTVCHCLFLETFKGQCENDSKIFAEELGNLRTVIFSSKFCNNVELEVGSYVRIHPTWKEVLGTRDEKIILCSYFSQILP